jgi:kynurenine formamidase
VEAAEWLAARKPKALAFDFFEEYIARLVDFSADDFVVHHVLLRDHDIPLIENITNLGALTKERVTLFAAPVKLVTAEGAFARVFAIED